MVQTACPIIDPTRTAVAAHRPRPRMSPSSFPASDVRGPMNCHREFGCVVRRAPFCARARVTGNPEVIYLGEKRAIHTCGETALDGHSSLISRGNKGALRIPLHSFQCFRRPGCSAKLLCFQRSSIFDAHRPYQIAFEFKEIRILGGNKGALSPPLPNVS